MEKCESRRPNEYMYTTVYRLLILYNVQYIISLLGALPPSPYPFSVSYEDLSSTTFLHKDFHILSWFNVANLFYCKITPDPEAFISSF